MSISWSIGRTSAIRLHPSLSSILHPASCILHPASCILAGDADAIDLHLQAQALGRTVRLVVRTLVLWVWISCQGSND